MSDRVSIDRLGKGAVAGLIASAPMTAAMVAMHRGLPVRERHTLPPRRITMRAATKVGLRKHLGKPERTGATLAAHFGYGTAVGASSARLPPTGLQRRPPPARGSGCWCGW